MTVPLFFLAVPSCGWSKLGHETAVKPTGQCLNLWFLIELCSFLMFLSLFLATEPRFIIAVLIVFPVLTGSRLDTF